MADLSPPIGTNGLFTVQEPFIVDTTRTYTVTQLQSISAAVAGGRDVFGELYAPLGIARSVYDADLKNDINLVSMSADGLPTVVLPGTFIINYPDSIIVPYGRTILSVDLGILPKDFTAELLREEISTLSANITGQEAYCRLHYIKDDRIVSQEQHELRLNQRAAAVSHVHSSITEAALYRDKVVDLEERIRVLESIIVSLS